MGREDWSRELLNFYGHTAMGELGVVRSPDGSRMVTCSFDETAKVWDARTGAELLPNLKGHAGELKVGVVQSRRFTHTYRW